MSHRGIAIATGVGAVAALSVIVTQGCTFPDYVIVTGDAASDAVATEATVEAAPGCDGLAPSIAKDCTCGSSGDAGDDSAETSAAEAGPTGSGLSACLYKGGGFGSCVGCAEDTACVGATVPAGTTCIPGGIFSLGSINPSGCGSAPCANEGPEHNVAMTHFVLDDHEVTVGRFRTWWNSKTVPTVGTAIFTAGDGTPVVWDASWTIKEPATGTDMTWLGATNAGNDKLPLNGVDWMTALAFCMSLPGPGRLPTEAEWEAAASMRVGAIYPWAAANTRDGTIDPTQLTCAHATSKASGTDCGPPANKATSSTTDGAYDLAGSVAEWVLDIGPGSSNYSAGPFADPIRWDVGVSTRGVRGGSYQDSDPAKLRAQVRAGQPANTQSAAIGLRCARRM